MATLLRKVTKDLRIAKKVTIVGKLPDGAPCLEVKERPQESAKKTGCLKSATVVSAVGTPDEAGWIRIERPVRGWIPAKITSEGFVWDERQGSTRTSGRSGARHKEASSEPGVSGTYPSAPSSRPSGEHRQVRAQAVARAGNGGDVDTGPTSGIGAG